LSIVERLREFAPTGEGKIERKKRIVRLHYMVEGKRHEEVKMH